MERIIFDGKILGENLYLLIYLLTDLFIYLLNILKWCIIHSALLWNLKTETNIITLYDMENKFFISPARFGQDVISVQKTYDY
jgi:hypothetical protein